MSYLLCFLDNAILINFSIQIVHIGSLKASAIKDKNFNSGNVNFELQVKENTTLEVYENYTPNFIENVVPEEVSILEAYDNVGKTVSKL